MALLSRKLSTLGERVRHKQASRLKSHNAAPPAATKRGVGLWCCLALACGLPACEEPSSSGFFTEGAPPTTADEPIYDPDSFRHHRLDNGLATILWEDPSAPTAMLGIRVRRGAGSVDRQHAGLAKLTAALMDRGAGERDAPALTRAVRELSGVLEVNASWDKITVEMEGPADDIDRLVEILADVVMRPHFKDEAAESAVNQLVTRLRNSRNAPRRLQRHFAADLLYPNHRAGLPLEGTEATVSALTSEDARGFHSEIFVPNNALFFAAGAFDADELLTLVTEAFDGWAPGPMPPAAPPHPSPVPDARRVLIVDRPGLVKSTRVSLAHDGIPRQSPDRGAAHLLNEVIELSAIFMVRGESRMYRGGGTYSLAAVTHSNKVRRVVDLLLAELERVRKQPIAEPELEQARTEVLARFARSLAPRYGVFSALIELDNYEMPEDSLAMYRSRTRAITAEDLEQYARRLLHPDRAAIVLIGPAEILLPQLDGLGPVEVVQHPPVPEASPAADDLPPAAGESPPGADNEPPARAG